MKLFEQLLKLAALAAAVAAIAYLVVKYFDRIKAWVQSICPCCDEESDFFEDDDFAEPEAFAQDEAPAEAPAVEEAPVEPAPTADDNAPVAEEDDFQA